MNNHTVMRRNDVIIIAENRADFHAFLYRLNLAGLRLPHFTDTTTMQYY